MAAAAWRRRARRHHRRRRPRRPQRRERLGHQRHAAPGRRHALRHDARQRVGDGRARRPRAVALPLEDPRRHAHRQSRRRDLERLSLLRNAGQLPRLARGEDRQGALARRDRQLRRAVLLDDRADHRRQPRDRRHRQRPRHAGLPAVVRRGDRQVAMEVLYRADEPRRSGARHVGQSRSGASRRRHAVAAGRLRSRDQALYLRHRQSDPRLHRRPRRRRQPLYLLADRGQRRHRQDGVVLPDVAA